MQRICVTISNQCGNKLLNVKHYKPIKQKYHLYLSKIKKFNKGNIFSPKNEMRDTPLHLACTYGHHEIVRKLISNKYKCNIFINNTENFEPIELVHHKPVLSVFKKKLRKIDNSILSKVGYVMPDHLKPPFTFRTVSECLESYPLIAIKLKLKDIGIFSRTIHILRNARFKLSLFSSVENEFEVFY